MAAPSSHNAEDCANTGKRYVTFNETISVKNEKDLIFKKPMKLEIVVENWKSDKVNTPTEIIEPNPGVVRRLVDEYNTIQEVSMYNINNNIIILIRGISKELSREKLIPYLPVFINNSNDSYSI